LHTQILHQFKGKKNKNFILHAVLGFKYFKFTPLLYDSYLLITFSCQINVIKERDTDSVWKSPKP
jgi:hypothetical protein